MHLKIDKAVPSDQGSLLTGKMTWVDLDGAETAVTGIVTREKVDPRIVSHLHLDSPAAQMYDVKVLQLVETSVITDSPTIVPSTYRAVLIRNALLGTFVGTDEANQYSCAGQFYVNLKESLPPGTEDITDVVAAFEQGSDEMFWASGERRKQRHTEEILASMHPGSVWVGVATDSLLHERPYLERPFTLVSSLCSRLR